MGRTLAVLLGAAVVAATVDLVQKGVAISEHRDAVFTHERSTSYVVGLVAISFAWVGAIVLVRSTAIALPGGLVLGGAIGNLASIALWPSLPGVPDPIVAREIAFNLADVSALLGLALFIPAILVFALRSRERLFEPF